MMKLLIVLFALLASTNAQRFSFLDFFRQPSRFQPLQTRTPLNDLPSRSQPQQTVTRTPSDDRYDGSEYHFSWLHDGNQKYTGQQAAAYCRRLSGGWQPISIETTGENNFVTRIIQRHRLDYIWTGATRSGSRWSWPSGESFRGFGWSNTGAFRRPQPDNREQSGENCLAILNNFYGDGVKWHDVACHHTKPVICERRA